MNGGNLISFIQIPFFLSDFSLEKSCYWNDNFFNFFLIKKYQRFNKSCVQGVSFHLHGSVYTHIGDVHSTEIWPAGELCNFLGQIFCYKGRGGCLLKGSMQTLYLNFIWNTRLIAIDLLSDMLQRSNHLRWRNIRTVFSMAT